MLAALVVGGIALAVGLDRRVEAGERLVDIVGRIEIDDQRPDLGPQEMVRAAGAERGQPFQLLRVDELQHCGLVVEMADLALVCRDHAADRRHQPRGDGAALGGGKVLRTSPPKAGLPCVSPSTIRARLMMRSVVA